MIRVFLADDHAVVRDGLRLLLEAQGDITVVGEASDGRQTVLQVGKLKPDVVIMDIAMPELNGIDATDQILKTSSDIQVIVLSMYATTEHIYRALRAGAKGYLMKESAGAEVVDAVRAVNKGRRYMCRKIDDIMIDDYIYQQQAERDKCLLETLSLREREVMQLVVEGKTSAEIAAILYLSPKTVETYRSRLMQKLSIDDVPTLVKFDIQHGITPLK